MLRILLIAYLSLLIASTAFAVDYGKVDRSIVREPSYKSGSPKYVLLLLGPSAKRVWVVIDDDTVYIDRNSDADLTSKKDRFEHAADGRGMLIEIPDTDGKTSYVIFTIQRFAAETAQAGKAFIGVMIYGSTKFIQNSFVDLADSPRTATLAHFNGPLTIGPVTVDGKTDPSLKLQTGKRSAELRAMVGTWTEYGRPVVVFSEEGGRGAIPWISTDG